MFLLWSAKSLNIQSLSPQHSTWASSWAQRTIVNDALRTMMTTFMSCEGYFSIKERALTMDIMKLKSTISSTCIYTHFCTSFKFQICRIGSWFQFNDETVTQIKCLGDNVPKNSPKVHEEWAKLSYTCVWEILLFQGQIYHRPKEIV